MNNFIVYYLIVFIGISTIKNMWAFLTEEVTGDFVKGLLPQKLGNLLAILWQIFVIVHVWTEWRN